jgi:hypothetical protein
MRKLFFQKNFKPLLKQVPVVTAQSMLNCKLGLSFIAHWAKHGRVGVPADLNIKDSEDAVPLVGGNNVRKSDLQL